MQRKRRDLQRIQRLETKVNLAEIYAEFTHSDRDQPLNWWSTRQGLISPASLLAICIQCLGEQGSLRIKNPNLNQVE